METPFLLDEGTQLYAARTSSAALHGDKELVVRFFISRVPSVRKSASSSLLTSSMVASTSTSSPSCGETSKY
ncbi:hypothetical protein DY000_02055665 [Brassica cretica]|uniref:Uncharacterized protein n=1 Tax=Brassica cretica TaxID=69181 RepID=A0ABQ7AH35_BRACR|nr:hypothetical protein DY000_02055665 [Brassica cretica]